MDQVYLNYNHNFVAAILRALRIFASDLGVHLGIPPSTARPTFSNISKIIVHVLSKHIDMYTESEGHFTLRALRRLPLSKFLAYFRFWQLRRPLTRSRQDYQSEQAQLCFTSDPPSPLALCSPSTWSARGLRLNVRFTIHQSHCSLLD